MAKREPERPIDPVNVTRRPPEQDAPNWRRRPLSPTTIRQAPEMFRLSLAATPADLEQFWLDTAADPRFPGFIVRDPFAPEAPRDLVDSALVIEPYVSAGRWVADCPECGGGIGCWEISPRACCLDCGRIYRVRWHRDSAAAETLLEVRRSQAEQHWHPHHGVKLADLREYNASAQLAVPAPDELRVAAFVREPAALADVSAPAVEHLVGAEPA